ncbi:MAG: right-handed parallel beta-helix repeat-containing protein [Planctomycetia bacterium]|nr:right-handed parallel beta-helix repeat-containing protein [Planctomycetia bacterium]
MSSVHDFGAAGDGQTDDTDAIRHALTDGEGLLEFPRGDYRITKTIVVDLAKISRTAIRGSGGTAKIIMAGPGPAFLFVGSHDKNAAPSSFKPGIWQHERMPLLSDIEITGDHPEADGVRLDGVMQPTLTNVLIRKVRHAVHITKRARNVLISHCHIYQNTGIGVFLDHVNLHQTIITGSHISYCRLGGVRIQGGEIRNLQITGNDIEYNNNREIGVPGADAEPTAEIYIDVEDGSVREGTICSNTLQATYSPNGSNIRFIGSGTKGNHRAGMWTIVGNLIGSQAINIHLTSALGFAISGNYIYSGHERNIVIEGSRSIAIGANTLGHNADYGDKELSTGIRFVDCEDCTVTGLILQDALAGHNTVAGTVPTQKEGLLELARCRRINLTGCQILEGTPNGIVLDDCQDTLISACMILDNRPTKLMKAAIVWRDAKEPSKRSSSGNLIHACRVGNGTEGNLVIPASVRQSENLLD